VAVKGSINHPMRIIPHRPSVRFVRFLGLLIVLASCFYAGVYYTQVQQHLMTDDKHLEQQKLVQEVAQLHTSADVDRQTIEDMRQLVMTQKAQMAASERYLSVYKELLASGAKPNPLGVSFGVFTVFPMPEVGHFNFKLVVQKLSAQETDFVGSLEFKVIGQQGDKPSELSLYQISTQATSSSIPLNLKYFQVLEGELQLPLDFVPKTVELAVKMGDRVIIKTQLEWPISSS
jgi:hypothetical protein